MYCSWSLIINNTKHNLAFFVFRFTAVFSLQLLYKIKHFNSILYATGSFRGSRFEVTEVVSCGLGVRLTHFSIHVWTHDAKGSRFNKQMSDISSLPAIDPTQLHIRKNQTHAHNACQSYLVLPKAPSAVVDLLMIQIHVTSHAVGERERESLHLTSPPRLNSERVLPGVVTGKDLIF